jgi:dinuclear metal center YbgI/SA1388 family protein
MKVGEILSVVRKLAPEKLQENYDNSGLITGSSDIELKGILLTLDITPDSIIEALDNQCNLIISHHPLVFKPLRTLMPGNPEADSLIMAIKHDISIYAAHTSLDNAPDGLNFYIANLLGLNELKTLQPVAAGMLKIVTFCPEDHADKVRTAMFEAGAGHIGNYDCCSFNSSGQGTFRALDGASPFVGKHNQMHFENEIKIETIVPAYLKNDILSALVKSHPYEEVACDVYPLQNISYTYGAGIIGNLKEPLPLDAFLKLVKSEFSTDTLRYASADLNKPVKRVAFCGGAGSFLIPNALSMNADAFISADFKYHDFLSVKHKMALIDAGHYETEIKVLNLLQTVITKNFPTFAPRISLVQSNPLKYYH